MRFVAPAQALGRRGSPVDPAAGHGTGALPEPAERLPVQGRYRLARPQDLSVVHQPVFIANGESDRMVPTKNSLELARRLPNADLVVYPDAGHGGIFQFHEQFVAEALDFLER
ncbi:alpha/beta fold hydrolase [Streptomyces scabiei]|uniref:alpha/beta fold hydrolase n=1 Tax=Streptomyces scabiei TaxID=1930 RepID=UPI000AF810D9|nr:alpha/beta hydrolase [Streptomyces scabiei]